MQFSVIKNRQILWKKDSVKKVSISCSAFPRPEENFRPSLTHVSFFHRFSAFKWFLLCGHLPLLLLLMNINTFHLIHASSVSKPSDQKVYTLKLSIFMHGHKKTRHAKQLLTNNKASESGVAETVV